MSWNDRLDVVVGLRVTGAELPNDETLVLTCADGTQHRYVVSGDCCSASWIEHLEVPALPPEGAEVLSVESVDMPARTDGKLEDEMQFYECRFKTTAGDIVAEFRNSSNGYYGGSIDYAGTV